MIVVAHGRQGGSSIRGEEEFFTGEVWRDIVAQDGNVGVGTVSFTPCARTRWHRHEGGQLLIIVAGEGYVEDEEGRVKVRAGDTIWTPPNVRHWHGATSDTFLVHNAITIGGVEWMEPVADANYKVEPVRPVESA
ncbi:cupin domain-containing protein [Rhodococcus opacus]|uniref:cupin domain-containing protein n=1 Tax=Rhodococcus opacus TaxID=37919 RepID=UPI001C4485BA|nr:cupin domain-containing protein [Rhodococcus opacus]MBV6756655.1 cupin domain-containing protein [Rhodococcus opacus]